MYQVGVSEGLDANQAKSGPEISGSSIALIGLIGNWHAKWLNSDWTDALSSRLQPGFYFRIQGDFCLMKPMTDITIPEADHLCVLVHGYV